MFQPTKRPRFTLCLTLLCCAMLSANAQSSKDGSFTGKTYTDRYFGIALDLPAILQPKPTSEINIKAADSAEAWMMFAAQQGSAPYGIVMITQLLHPDGKGISSAADFLRRVRNSRDSGDTIGIYNHQLNSRGLPFDWVDWKASNGEFDSAVVTQRGRYLLVARCNAKSESELQAMKNALFGMRLTGK